MSERTKGSRRGLLFGGGTAVLAAGGLATSLFLGHSDHKPVEAHKASQPAATHTVKCPEAAFETPDTVTFDSFNDPQTFLRVKVGACAAKKDVTMLNTPDPKAEISIVADGDDPVLHPDDIVDITCYTLGKDSNPWLYIDHRVRHGDDTGFVPGGSFGTGVYQAIMNGTSPYSEQVQLHMCNDGQE
jgi:hypothetical protein